MIELHELNCASAAQFAASLGGIFEHSPWVAERAAVMRPFGSRLALIDALRDVVAAASSDEQWALIRAHPQLGAQGLARAALTPASASEQQDAGLQTCTAADLQELSELNATYFRRFDMPFILAVRGHAPASILAALRGRLLERVDVERRTALEQIGLIAGFRLAEFVIAPAVEEIMARYSRLPLVPTGRGKDALLREWMLAAGLVVFAAGDSLLGRRAADRNESGVMLAEYTNETMLALLLAIAVVERLKVEQVTLAFELLLLKSPEAGAEVTAPALPKGASRELRWECMQIDTAHDAPTLRVLSRFGVPAERNLSIARPREPTSSLLADEVSALEDFLKSPQPTRRIHG